MIPPTTYNRTSLFLFQVTPPGRQRFWTPNTFWFWGRYLLLHFPKVFFLSFQLPAVHFQGGINMSMCSLPKKIERQTTQWRDVHPRYSKRTLIHKVSRLKTYPRWRDINLFNLEDPFLDPNEYIKLIYLAYMNGGFLMVHLKVIDERNQISTGEHISDPLNSWMVPFTTEVSFLLEFALNHSSHEQKSTYVYWLVLQELSK